MHVQLVEIAFEIRPGDGEEERLAGELVAEGAATAPGAGRAAVRRRAVAHPAPALVERPDDHVGLEHRLAADLSHRKGLAVDVHVGKALEETGQRIRGRHQLGARVESGALRRAVVECDLTRHAAARAVVLGNLVHAVVDLEQVVRVAGPGHGRPVHVELRETSLEAVPGDRVVEHRRGVVEGEVAPPGRRTRCGAVGLPGVVADLLGVDAEVPAGRHGGAGGGRDQQEESRGEESVHGRPWGV